MTKTQRSRFLTAKERKNLPLTSISSEVVKAARTIIAAIQCSDPNITSMRREAACRLFSDRVKFWNSRNTRDLPPADDKNWLRILALQAIAWGNLLYPKDGGIDRALLVSLVQSNGTIDGHISDLLNYRLRGIQIGDAKKFIENLSIQVKGFVDYKSKVIKADDQLLIEVWTGTGSVPPLAMMTNEAAAKAHSELFRVRYSQGLTVKSVSDFSRYRKKLGLLPYRTA